MTQDIKCTRMKVGDTYAFEHQFVWDDNNIVDLTSVVSVSFHMWEEINPTLLLVDSACTIVPPATSGKVSYDWVAGETDIAGMYRIAFVATWNDGSILTSPSGGEMYLWIMEA